MKVPPTSDPKLPFAVRCLRVWPAALPLFPPGRARQSPDCPVERQAFRFPSVTSLFPFSAFRAPAQNRSSLQAESQLRLLPTVRLGRRPLASRHFRRSKYETLGSNV